MRYARKRARRRRARKRRRRRSDLEFDNILQELEIFCSVIISLFKNKKTFLLIVLAHIHHVNEYILC